MYSKYVLLTHFIICTLSATNLTVFYCDFILWQSQRSKMINGIQMFLQVNIFGMFLLLIVRTVCHNYRWLQSFLICFYQFLPFLLCRIVHFKFDWRESVCEHQFVGFQVLSYSHCLNEFKPQFWLGNSNKFIYFDLNYFIISVAVYQGMLFCCMVKFHNSLMSFSSSIFLPKLPYIYLPPSWLQFRLFLEKNIGIYEDICMGCLAKKKKNWV